MRCFRCKKYGHLRRDCSERSDKKKGDNPSTALVEEHKEYIEDVLTLFKSMSTFSHDK